jgi:CBS domain-containing protein
MTAQTVGEIYTERVFTVAPSDPVSAAADLMAEHKLHALPVVEHNQVVGIVARIDIIRTLND